VRQLNEALRCMVVSFGDGSPGHLKAVRAVTIGSYLFSIRLVSLAVPGDSGHATFRSVVGCDTHLAEPGIESHSVS
jgi:hypothetical protein